MDFRILGPLEVVANGRPLTLGGAKPRAVLAVLLLHANETVSVDRLIDALWGESAPNGAVPTGAYYSAAYDPDSRIQVSYNGWYADSLVPSNFVHPIYDCDKADNFSRYCDRALDAEIDRTVSQSGTNPVAPIDFWADADRRITDAAPAVGLLNRKSAVLVSERVENVQQHPLFGLLEDQLWVR
jgi:hypothetical protein